MAHPTAEHESEVLRSCVEQAVFAEEMGFDRIWAVEHHALKWYAHMSAPEVFLAWVAAKTSRIRIGHGVVCMPFNYNHPVRVGERAAMLDTLSGGRLDLGAGRGATEQEMSLCGVSRATTKDEVAEALRMIGAMWQEDEFSWEGSFSIPPHSVLPRPEQRPHPPLYLACSRDDTVALAAEYGVGALALGFSGPDKVATLRKVYDNTIATRTGAQFVSTVVNDHFSALCPTIVLDDATLAYQTGIRGQRFFQESITHWARGGPAPEEDVDYADNEAVLAALEEEKSHLPASDISSIPWSSDHAYGDAARAIDYVEALIASGADEIMCLIQMGTVSHQVCMETIRQWGTTVIPHFRASAA